jgi:tetratricopeptide (TPR) repeat protein
VTGADNGLIRGRGLFAVRMTELMQENGRSFRTLAAAVHADPGYLNKVANGTRPVPGPSLVAALDTALGADGQLVDLARREAIPHQATTLRMLGEAEEARARATTAHLVALDTLQGSDGLVPVATRAFRTVADQLAVVGGTADVRSAVADLGTAAAWIAADATERDQSRTLALEALALADLAGDTRLHRFLLSHLSMVSEHAGRHGDALAYAERLLAESPDNPRVLAMIQVRRARALSGLGAYNEALDAWDHAEHKLTESPSADDGLTYWIHDSEMAIHKAVILSRARSREAVDWAHRGVEWLPDVQGRDQVLFRTMLLLNAVAAHAWREVPAIVEDLLRHAGSARSARVPELLAQVWRAVAGERVPAPVRDAVRTAYEAF